MCTDTELARSECCPTRVNPITLQRTCSCFGQGSGNPLYVVWPDCTLHDVNECSAEPGPCAGKAVCMNYDGTATSPGFECQCPPGMVGDGVTRCDVYVYETSMTILARGLSFSSFSETSTIDALMQPGVLPAGTERSDIIIEATLYSAPQQRRLLQSEEGVQIDIVILSDSSQEMQAMTAGVNTESVLTGIENLYTVTASVLTEPTSVIKTVDSAFGPVNTVLPGLKVANIVYNDTAWEWVVNMHYTANMPNTLTSPYISKSGLPPYANSVTDSFSISKHPCMVSASVCCLGAYSDKYVIGAFSDNISSSVGVCDAAVQAKDTNTLFSTDKNALLISRLLEDYPRSRVERLSPTSIALHLNRFDLRNEFAMRTDTVGGYQLSFFVGMSYYTLLPAAALATVATQSRITVVATDTLTFATTSEQDYSFLQYITVGLFENKVITDAVVVHNVQFVKVSFVIPSTLSQNLRTGLVPLTSVRFALAASLPEQSDTAQWKNPCYSSNGAGLFDGTVADGSPNPLPSLYALSAKQDCAIQPALCTNPPADPVVHNGFIEFWFPIGEDVVNEAVFTSTERKNLYIHFDLSVVDTAGRGSITNLFAQAPVTYLSVSRFCETLEAASTVNDILAVSLAVGTVGTEEEWGATMTEFTDVLRTENPLLETGAQIQALSLQAGLLTLSVAGEESAFSSQFSSPFHVEIDSMVSMHFLDSAKFDDISAKMGAGTAYTVVRNTQTGSLEVELSTAVNTVCASAVIVGDVSCAVRRDIDSRNIASEYAVHSLASGVNTRDESADVDWLTDNMFGNSEFGRGYAANFTNLVRKHYNVNDRYNKAWFINPGYPWVTRTGAPAQSILRLSDKMILIAVITIDDENPTTGASGGRRMILEMAVNKATGERTQSMRALTQAEDTAEQAYKRIIESPIESGLPSIINSDVSWEQQIANVYNAPAGRYRLFKTDFPSFPVPLGMSDLEIRNLMQSRLTTRLKKFAPSAVTVDIVQFNMKKNTNGELSRRRLLQTQPVDYDERAGYLTLLVTFNGTQTNPLFTETLLQTLLINIPIDATPAEQQVWAQRMVDASVGVLANDWTTNITALVQLSAVQQDNYNDLRNATATWVETQPHKHRNGEYDAFKMTSSSTRTRFAATGIACVLAGVLLISTL